ncbi:MAG: RdgB/HAM1 family non-canonical purine NTP pyrophosphatase [Tissierellia bacterium]|nr:RdgB/HAM1 family non-canonical purine NTP pyrophosphatase [Tissierellia bacterium]
MKKIVLASNNKHKIEEIKEIIGDLHIEILPKSEVGQEHFDVEETENTLEGNALLKAQGLKDLIGSEYMVIADDTGLFVDYLNGEPGVHTSRFAGKDHDDAANNALMLEKLDGVPYEKRTCEFRTTVAIVEDGKEPEFVTGILKGHIAEELRGEEGFGYDPLFIPEEFDKTFAELGTHEKNQISHRRRAFEKFADYIRD